MLYKCLLMVQMCPAKSTIVPFKKQMYSSGSIILSYKDDKCICVSIHAPTRGCDAYLRYNGYHFSKFQSTHPRGVRQRLIDTVLILKEFQSTHPRGVRCSEGRHSQWRVQVSIHAPTRGATLVLRRSVTSHRVSIHAPTRGATFLFISLYTLL